jgi:hypothetical protein
VFATFAGGYSRRPNPGLDDVMTDADSRLLDGSLDPADGQEIADGFVREILLEMAVVGLSIVGEGGVRSRDRVLPLIRGLDGVSAGETIALPDGEPVTRPVVKGPVRWTRPMTTRDWQFADAETDLVVKQTFLGPFSLAALAEPLPSRRRVALALQFAEALNEEILALAAVGCPMIEIDEPYALQIGADGAEWRGFHAAHERLWSGLEDPMSPHPSLGLWGGEIAAAGHRALLDLPYMSYLVDVLAGPSAWHFIGAVPAERGIIVGSADAANEAMDETEVHVWAMAWAAQTGRGSARVGCAPNGSLTRIGRHFAHRKCSRLGEAVNIAGMGPLQEVAIALDEDPAVSPMAELRAMAAAVEAGRSRG